MEPDQDLFSHGDQTRPDAVVECFEAIPGQETVVA